jgi:hypothetical protein
VLEGYIEEGRALWTELAERPSPERVGTLYDKAANWQGRVIADLQSYHSGLAADFERGGDFRSPQLPSIAPTDCANLQVCVERRGQVLRNVLDGTPGKNLRWETDSIF